MYLSAEALEFIDGRCDVSFDRNQEWRISEFDQEMRTLQFALGDGDSGPLVMLAAMSVHPGDEQRFPPIIHMHRSDSFRTIVKGDFNIGRQVYTNGVGRLQESGTYYGPEQPGGASIARSGDIWSLLVFADKRGHRVHPADKKYLSAIEASDEAMDAFYRKLGVSTVLPKESSGEANLRTNPPTAVCAGYADMDFDQAGLWPRVGESRIAATAIGGCSAGSLVLALSAPAGVIAVPSVAWDVDMFIAVTSGSATLGGRERGVGDVRLQQAGSAFEEVRAGPEGLECYLVLSDHCSPSPATPLSENASAWVQQLKLVLQPLLSGAAKTMAHA